MVIVFSLLLLLLSLVAAYFVRGQQYIADTEAYLTAQREADKTLRQISTQLSRATTEHLKSFTQSDPSDDPSYIYFLSFLSDVPDAPYILFDPSTHNIVWRKWICFYHDPLLGELFRADIPLTPETSDLLNKPLPNVDHTSFLTANPKSIGRQITTFSVSDDSTNKVVTLALRARVLSPVPLRNDSDKLIEIRLRSQVTLPN